MHGILSLVKNLLCACPGQIPRYSGLEYQSYYFALLKKLSNTCPLKLLLHRGVRNLSNKTKDEAQRRRWVFYEAVICGREGYAPYYAY